MPAKMTPQSEQAVKMMSEFTGGIPIHELGVAKARYLGVKTRQPATTPEVHSIENITLNGPAGTIPCRLYRPSSPTTGDLPCVVHFHGGGWVLCSLDTHEGVCRALCAKANCVVVSVDYRMAPEFPFPAAALDCIAATNLVHGAAKELGINPAKIACAGDSAGGNLAAVVAQQCREILCYQVLVYPVTECYLETESYNTFAEGYGLTKATMQWFWDMYLQGQDPKNQLASPLLCTNYRGLPPAAVVVAECDVLKDDTEAYITQLQHARIPTAVYQAEGEIHGFWSNPLIDSREKAYDWVAKGLIDAFVTKAKL